MTKLTILTPADKLAEIRRLYFETTKQTIGDDLVRAVRLLKSMETEDERERATVYMDGLAQMRSDWARGENKKIRPSKSGRSQRADAQGAGSTSKAQGRSTPKGRRR
jgi:hypothetical protein